MNLGLMKEESRHFSAERFNEQQKRIADSLEFIGLVMTKDWYKGNDLGAMQCSRIHNDIKKMVGDEK